LSEHAAIPAITGSPSMRAWQALRYGAPDEALALRRVPMPTPGPCELCIRVAATSLNPIDLKLLRGDLKRLMPLRFPRTIGFDAAGEVDAVGAGARFAVGEQVFVRASRDTLGAFAQYSVQPQDFVARAPAGLDPVGAASLPLVGLTTVQGLVGADRVISYDREDYRGAGRVFDIVFDTLGGSHTLDAFDLVKPGGCVVSVAGPPDAQMRARFGRNPLARAAMAWMARKVEARSSERGVRYFRFLTESSGAQLAGIAALVEAGAIRPVIDSVFDFDDLPAAMARLGAGRSRGKLVLRVNQVAFP